MRGREEGIVWSLLGEVCVSINGEKQPLSGQRQRAILAFLILRAPRQATTEELIYAIWGDARPKTARNSIQRFVSDLRRALGPFAPRLSSSSDGYALAAEPGEIDVVQLEMAIAEGRSAKLRGDAAAAAEAYRRALAFWRGQALGGLGAANFAQGEVGRLEELRFSAVEEGLETELDLGRHRSVCGAAESFAQEHPTREKAWSLYMLALYRCGRPADAIAAYELLCERLLEEGGIRPPDSLRDLCLQIGRRAPELDSPAEVPNESEAPSMLGRMGRIFPLPGALEQGNRFPMCGRSEEKAKILSAGEGISMGDSQVVLVSGEAGIGKTRLVAESAETLRRGGMLIVYGRCEEDLSEPYQAWLEILEALVRQLTPGEIAAQAARFGHSLAALIPELRGPDIEEAVSGEDRQDLLFRAVLGLVEQVAETSPLTIILDDLHAADRSTLQLFQFVARRVSLPLLLVGTYRSNEVDMSHPLTNVLGILHRDCECASLELRGFEEADAHEVVRAMAVDADDDRCRKVSDTLLVRTNGNPFFFTQLLESMLETGKAWGEDFEASTEIATPESVLRVIEQRAARLGPEALKTLQVAAVLGREFQLDLLAEVAEKEVFGVLDDVEAAIGAALLDEVADARDRFSFRHDLTHRSLYDQLIESRRRRLHARAADALEATTAGNFGSRVEEFATHLVAAADPGQRVRIIEACRAAGRHAATLYAPGDAVVWFERALELLLEDAKPEARAHARLLMELGVQQRNVGDMRHAETLLESAQRAKSAGAADLLVRSVFENSIRFNSRTWEIDEERIGLVRSALETFGEEPRPEKAILLAILANEQWDEAHREEAKSIYEQAIALARETNHDAALATTLIRAARARNMRLPRTELHPMSAELIELSQRLEEEQPFLVLDCMTTVLNTALQLAIPDEAEFAMRRIWELEDRFGLPRFSQAGHITRTLLAGLRGDMVEYEKLAGMTSDLDLAFEEEEEVMVQEGHLFYARYVQGRGADLLPVLKAIADARPEAPLYRAVFAVLAGEAREIQDARSVLSAECERGFELPMDMFSIQSLTLWAEAAGTCDHVEACRMLLEILMPFTGEMAGHISQLTQPIDLALGRMHFRLGEFAAAEDHLSRARTIAEGFQAKWMCARIDLAEAEICTARAEPGDLRRAEGLARSAHCAAQSFGYGNVERDANDLISALASP